MGQLVWPALILGAAIIIASIIARDKHLLLFFSSLALSEILLIAAGVFERRLADPSWPILIFIACQAGLLVFCALQSKGERVVVILASLCFIYALLVSFVAGMGFTGDWL